MHKNLLTLAVAGIVTCSFYSYHSQAEEVRFSIGTGLPFVLLPEISYHPAQSDIRYYANLKGSVESGVSFGFEMPTENNPNHAVGAYIGTIGVREGDEECPVEVDDATDIIVEPLACAFAALFDWETVNGVGVTYSYSWNGLNQSGWRARFELGYGRGSDSDNNYGSGAIVVSYQF